MGSLTIGETPIDEAAASIKERFGWVDVDMFKAFVTDRARAIQSVAAYLAAYVDFNSDQTDERIDELTRNTLAWHLADDATRENLIEVFRMTAKAIKEAGVRRVCRMQQEDLNAVLDTYPAYFQGVAEELRH